jgi:hypothetical protein
MNEFKKKLTAIFFPLLAVICVFLFYSHTLNYSWKFFDEEIIYSETIFPIPKDFSNYIEIVKNLGLKNHFEASNTFYSNIANVRGTPLDTIFLLTIFLLFKKSAFCYHLFSLVLHSINTFILGLSISKVLSFNRRGSAASLSGGFLACILSLMWALHPGNVESILFATNIGALVTYFFCSLYLLLYIKLLDIENKTIKDFNLFQKILIFTFYLFPLFLNEYSVTLPIMIFLLIFLYSRSYVNLSLIESIKTSFNRTLPLILALLVFILYFIIKLLSSNVSSSTTDISLIFERVFWLSPQIFFHFIKLILYPQFLSIDQTSLVNLGQTMFSPQVIFCFLSMYAPLLLSLFILFKSTKKKIVYFTSLTFLLFFISLLPFLHILSPIYNLASERYLYLPTYALILGLSHFLNFSNKKSYLIILSASLISLGIFSYRTFTRSLEWKDSRTLLESAIQTAPNKLFKGLRTLMIAHSIKESASPNLIEIERIRKDALKIIESSLIELNNTTKSSYRIPGILKFYGLDNKTLAAKNAFLLAMCRYELGHKRIEVKETFSPYIRDLKVIDSQILRFYYPILFFTNDIDTAEKILISSLNSKRYNSNLFLALADISEYKYRNIKAAENYLLKSFELFPYDPTTLFGLKRIYRVNNDYNKFAHYSYLYELRTHDPISLQEAVTGYLVLKDKKMSRKLLDRLNKEYSSNESTDYLNQLYKKVFND